MRFFVFFALVVASLVIVPGAGAAAPNGTQNQTAATYISDGLRLVESGYNSSTGTAYVVLTSESPQSVTISDGGALADGSGEIASTTAVVDGPTRIEVSATPVDGRVAVIIDSKGTLYGHIIRNKSTESALIGGPFDARDVQVSAVAGAVTVALFVIGQLVRYKRGTTHEPERIA